MQDGLLHLECSRAGSDNHGSRFRNMDNRHSFRRRLMRVRMCAAGEPVDKVVRRPGAGELHLILPHRGTGGGKLVQVALHTFAVDQVGYVQCHLAFIR